MANIKSQKKRILTNETARQRNVQVRSRLKTVMKNADSAIESKDADSIQSTVKTAVREIDRTAKKGIIHKGTASRYKSRLTLQVQKMA